MEKPGTLGKFEKKNRNSENLGRNFKNLDKISIKMSQPWVQNLKVAETHWIIEKPRIWHCWQKNLKTWNLKSISKSKNT